MDREELALLFYGEGRMPPPWATARSGSTHGLRLRSWPPDRASVDVILAVNEEHGVRRVLDHLAKSLATSGVPQDMKPIAAGGFVAVRVTLDELVRLVLPMTNLYGVVRLAQELSDNQLSAAVEQAAPENPGYRCGQRRQGGRGRAGR